MSTSIMRRGVGGGYAAHVPAVALALLVVLLLTPTRDAGAQGLQAQVSLNRTGGGVTWTYALRNVEPTASGNWLSSFLLNVDAPVSNVLSPAGWTAETDFLTYVLWYNADDYPFPNDVAPLRTLSGFTFTSAGEAALQDYRLFSWNHLLDQSGPDGEGRILAPRAVAGVDPVPEPGAYATALVMIAATGLALIRGRWRARTQ